MVASLRTVGPGPDWWDALSWNWGFPATCDLHKVHGFVERKLCRRDTKNSPAARIVTSRQKPRFLFVLCYNVACAREWGESRCNRTLRLAELLSRARPYDLTIYPIGAYSTAPMVVRNRQSLVPNGTL
eukprot:702525-Rhodomonas_salina.1